MNPLDLMFRIADRANLAAAWERVCANRGGPGIDGVTIRTFKLREQQELDSIESDLLAGTYHPDTIQTFTVLKESGKTRVIGLMTLRDRICAFAVTRVLRSLLEPVFQPCSFAYRPGRSATDAANYVEKLIRRGMTHVLETDIQSYFDTINHHILMSKLEKHICDSSVIDLIQRFLKVRITGVIKCDTVTLGVTQGSPLSPLFSNLYLNELDKIMLQAGYRYVRYADDLVVLGKNRIELEEALAALTREMIRLDLQLAPDKTRLATVAEGFVFLGFKFDETGKGPAMKSIETIREKLRETALSNHALDAETRIAQIQDILRGWRQYFQMAADVFVDMPAVVLAAALREAVEMKVPELFQVVSMLLLSIRDSSADIQYRTAAFLSSRMRHEIAACHYLAALMNDDLSPELSHEALQFLELTPENWITMKTDIAAQWDKLPSEDAWRNMSEIFAESGAYELAMLMETRVRGPHDACSSSMISSEQEHEHPVKDVEQKVEIPDTDHMPEDSAPNDTDEISDGEKLEQVEFVRLTETGVSMFARHFRGRDGVLAFESIDERGNKTYRKCDIGLSRDRLEEHWAGNSTCGIFMVHPDETVHCCLFDIDVKKRHILLRAEQNLGFEDLVEQTHSICRDLYEQAKQLGIHGLMEDSGYKGRHLWFFFAQPVSMKIARQLLTLVMSKVEIDSDTVCIELFPGRDHLKSGGLGDLIKLPLGINRKSGRFSRFINPDGRYPDQNQALHTIRPVTKKKACSLLERVIPNAAAKKQEITSEVKISGLDSIPSRGPIRKVVKQCAMMRYLINKAQKINHLTHMERVTLLYVFGHLGDEGKAFLHRIIAYCMNYDPNYTQDQIARMKPSPISCPRIKETFPQITSTLHCNCYFGALPENVYPTPVLYADEQKMMKNASYDSKPARRHASESSAVDHAPSAFQPGASETAEEVNTLIKKYMNIRRNYRGIEKAIKQIENRLLVMMREQEMDALETEFGTLRYITPENDKPRFIIEM